MSLIASETAVHHNNLKLISLVYFIHTHIKVITERYPNMLKWAVF